MSWSLEEAIAYYKSQGAPGNQNALISLLKEAQLENGGSIPLGMLRQIGEGCAVKESMLLAIVRRIPSLRLEDGHCLELCAGANCGKHTALADFAEKAAKANDGMLRVKFVPCMRLCGKGPNIKWDGRHFHQADEALLRRLMEQAGLSGGF